MYEERERFSWTSLFIKIIIIVIFVLFTIWLLQLSFKSATKDMSNGINVLTDNIFSQNIDKMKDVGKSYFTTERLPKKIGEVKTLTLEEMYKKNLILEVKDKNGKACSAKNSYVAIEKLETEYQMKVYLECGSEHNFIKVIMGCYNYCNTDICEKKEPEEVTNKAIEYQYSKTTGGAWGPWGSWTNWSQTEVSKNNYRDVETKMVSEPYTYEKTVTEEKYVGAANVCATISGYTLVSNKDGVCSYKETNPASKNPECPSVSGYKLTGRNGFTCNYQQSTQGTANPECPSISGYTLTGRNGFTCNYQQSTQGTANPECPTVSGYTLTGRNGFTCNYKKNAKEVADPECPNISGYTLTNRNGFTCNYQQSTQGTTNPVCPDVAKYTLTDRNGFTCNYSRKYYVVVGTKIVSACKGCAKEVQNIYEERYAYTTSTATCPNGYSQYGNTCVAPLGTTTSTAECPSGYNQSGNICVAPSKTIPKTAECPSGYSKSGNTCVAPLGTTTKTAECPSGYSKSGNTCVAPLKTTTKTATCPKGYSKSGNTCVAPAKTVENAATCPSGQTQKDNKCYKTVSSTVIVNDTKNVTYYRYRLRDYNGGNTDYKWSPSNNDKSLLDAGYKLTGRTREVGGK